MDGGPRGREWVDQLLLRWCQQSAPGEETVAVGEPLRIDPRLRAELGRLGRALDRLFRRWANGILAGDPQLEDYRPPAFPLAKEIFAAGPLPAPFFWARFDIFERADGGLAVLEYNCDKPAGQREIWATEALPPHRHNVNRGALARFRRSLAVAWTTHRRRFGIAARAPRLAILADPAHREEFRLAYLFGREAAALGWSWDVAGPDNLVVQAGRPAAYGRPVDVVLRQYPAEYLHELPAAPALWTATAEGRPLWLNDPRAVVAQAKSAFAHLWVLVEEDRWLTRGEAALVRRSLPRTGLASSPGWLDRARARPEDYVLKPVLGRYSEKVRVGALCSAEDWQRGLEEVGTSPDDWVIQAYVPPRRRWLPDAASRAAGRPGYVNWGLYLSAGQPAGICPRFQPTPLTEEGRVWWAPIVARRTRSGYPTILKPDPALMGPHHIGSCWRAIADRRALAGYANVWTDGLANFKLAAVGLTPAAWDELAHATLVIGHAVGRVLAHLDRRPELVGSLGIPGALAALVSRVEAPREWSFLSRLDWARTTDGQWKLMEINSDTPAGLWEAGSVAREVARLHGRADSINDGFWPALVAAWQRSARPALGSGADQPCTIGMIGSLGAPEDRDQLRAHEQAARRALPRADIEWGLPEDIVVRHDRAWLRGQPLDLLFRYYPLHWLATPRFEPLLALVRAGRLPMLPAAHSLIPQSKAFLALLWELLDRGFFPPAEGASIRRHVPRTTLDPRRLGRAPYVVKPYLEHEGLGVLFSEELTRRERQRAQRRDVVYQERIDLTRVRLPVGTAAGWRVEKRSLVFGVFLADAHIAGVYTRAGARVTGREAVFVPVLLADPTGARQDRTPTSSLRRGGAKERARGGLPPGW